MAWVADQKGNRLPFAEVTRSTQYFPAGQGGNSLTASAVFLGVTAASAGNVQILTLTGNFKFKMSNQIVATFAHGQPQTQGLIIGDSTLEAPTSGNYSYSGGNHPVIQVAISNITNSPITLATGIDLVVAQT